MAIYGTAILSVCLLIGLIVGKLIGQLLGLNANVGGVGIAMLLLILVCDALHRRGKLAPPSNTGVLFWSAIYIPIVVAMAASQNIVAAVEGGRVAVTAGVLSVIACFALVPLISRMSGDETGEPEAGRTEAGKPEASKTEPTGDRTGQDSVESPIEPLGKATQEGSP